MIGDKAQRFRAIPFRANWYDNFRIGNTFINDGDITGDLSVIKTGAGNGGMVRFARPFKGDIISAKLTLQGEASNVTPTTLRIFKGDFDTDAITALGLSTYTETRIAEDWKKVTGESAAYSYGAAEAVLIDGLNLMPLIPRRGDSDYNEDGFIIGFDLDVGAPADWHLYTFKLDCLVRMAKP
jgi:hypothetical protein